jgi:hypothetical protein
MSVVDEQEEFKAEVAEAFEKAGLMESTPESKAFNDAFDQDDDEDDFRARVWNAEQECRRRELAVELAKSDLKIAKEEYDTAVDRLRRIASEGTQPTLPIFGEPSKANEPEALPEPSLAWRERPFMGWLETKSGIRGLGVKKKDALYEIVENFGDFEDLRVKAQQESKHLCELLPKGFGEDVTDAIVEAFLVAKDEPWIDRMNPLPIVTDKMPAAARQELERKWRDYAEMICDEDRISELELDQCDLHESASVQMAEGYDAFESDLAVHVCDADTIDGQSDWVYGWCLGRQKERLMAAAEKAEEQGDE